MRALFLKSRSATFTLNRLHKGQISIRLDPNDGIIKVWCKSQTKPARQSISVNTPTLRRVIYIICNGSLTPAGRVVCTLHRAHITIDTEILIFSKQPASCAARLFINANWQIKRLDHISQIETYTAIRAITAHVKVEFILLNSQLEKQEIIIICLPSRKGRRGLSFGTIDGSLSSLRGDRHTHRQRRKRRYSTCSDVKQRMAERQHLKFSSVYARQLNRLRLPKP